MLRPSFFYEALQTKGVEFISGVPDSLLKDYGAYVFDKGHTSIAANEGGAIGIATGYHLATGKIPLVYMQNSGFGNIINPITSLADPDVYSIPMLLLIGWRGEPGVKDEPQHKKQGRIMEAMLISMEIPYCILDKEEKAALEQLNRAFEIMQKNSEPFVVLVSAGTFEKYTLANVENENSYDLKREDALEVITQGLSDSDIIVSTTGKTSRELYELREKYSHGHQKDFLSVGSMGHASQIALGIAMEKSRQQVFCIDGDGAVIMHMGALAIIGESQLPNFKHIVINNGAHESVGGQPTAGFKIDFGEIAKGCGYKKVLRTESLEELTELLPDFTACEGPALLEIMTSVGSRKDLGRPKETPVENKKAFMAFLNSL